MPLQALRELVAGRSPKLAAEIDAAIRTGLVLVAPPSSDMIALARALAAGNAAGVVRLVEALEDDDLFAVNDFFGAEPSAARARELLASWGLAAWGGS